MFACRYPANPLKPNLSYSAFPALLPGFRRNNHSELWRILKTYSYTWFLLASADKSRCHTVLYLRSLSRCPSKNFSKSPVSRELNRDVSNIHFLTVWACAMKPIKNSGIGNSIYQESTQTRSKGSIPTDLPGNKDLSQPIFCRATFPTLDYGLSEVGVFGRSAPVSTGCSGEFFDSWSTLEVEHD